MLIVPSYDRLPKRPTLRGGFDAFDWHHERVKVRRGWERDGLLWVPTYRCAFSLGVGPQQAGDSGGQAQITLTGCTAGRSILLLLWWASSTITLSSITSSGGETVTTKTTRTHSGLPVRHCFAYIHNISSSGNRTITVDWSGSLSGAGIVWGREVAGGDTSSAAAFFDVEGTAQGTSSTAQVTLSCADNDLAACIVTATTDESGWTPNAGFTTITLIDSNWWDNGVYQLDTGAAGNKTPGMSLGSSVSYMATAAAFKVAGGGAATERHQTRRMRQAGGFF